jgi:putative heme-binding domain-containing protein
LFDAAREAARASDGNIDSRIAATALLGRDESHADDDIKLLTSLLNPPAPAIEQTAAVRSLARFNRDEIPGILLHAWKDAAASAHGAMLDAMIGREPWAYELLKQVEARKFSGADIDLTHRQRLVRSASARVRELADKTVGESSGLSRTKVLANYRGVTELTGDATRGEKVFAANCVTCHHLGNVGQEIGPNLQSVAAWPADALMVAILDPSRGAEPRYLGFNCLLDTGETVYGLVISESAAGATMKGIDGKERVIPRRQVKSLECTNRSLMPDGLEAAIDKQAMADLIKFLQTQGQRERK